MFLPGESKKYSRGRIFHNIFHQKNVKHFNGGIRVTTQLFRWWQGWRSRTARLGALTHARAGGDEGPNHLTIKGLPRLQLSTRPSQDSSDKWRFRLGFSIKHVKNPWWSRGALILWNGDPRDDFLCLDQSKIFKGMGDSLSLDMRYLRTLGFQTPC